MSFQKTLLKDGSTLITVKIPKSLSATFMIFSKSGPKFDPKNKTGLSHFTEHMLFEGTKKHKNSEILSRTLENYGAWAGGFSYYETNTYTTKISKENLPVAIDILMDQVQNSLFRSKDIEMEKGRVAEEFNMVRSNPYDYISELWSENIWKNNALGRMYTGNLENINSFSRDDILNFMRDNYFPKGTVYVVAGDFKTENIKILINKHLSKQNLPNTRTKIITKVVRDNPFKIEFTKTDSITVNYGFLTVNRQNFDSNVLELLEYLLGRGLGSRLNQSIANKGLTYSIKTQTQHLQDTGYFLINFTSQKKNLNKILFKINQQLTDIKTEKITNGELSRAKGYYIGQLLVNNETTDALASWYGYQAINNPKKILNIEEKQNLIKGITKKDLIKVANKYFNKNNWYLSAIGPIKEKDIEIKF